MHQTQLDRGLRYCRDSELRKWLELLQRRAQVLQALLTKQVPVSNDELESLTQVSVQPPSLAFASFALQAVAILKNCAGCSG